VDLIVDSLDDGDHPFHLHGHTFFIVGVSFGTVPFEWRFSDTVQWGVGRYIGQRLNATAPMRRDTVTIPRYSWMALRFTTDNPGVSHFQLYV